MVRLVDVGRLEVVARKVEFVYGPEEDPIDEALKIPDTADDVKEEPELKGPTAG